MSGQLKNRREEQSFTCIHCQKKTNSLYRKYSEGVIRLTECEYCNEIVDKYIEYDTVLLVIDLMLQYIEAYRHLLCNVQIQRPGRLFIIFWFSHAYEKWIRDRMKDNTEKVYDLEWMFYKCVLQSAVEIGVFISVILIFGLIFYKDTSKLKNLAYSTLFGFYGTVAVVISIVFRLTDQTPYNAVVQIFLLASHYQVQRVLFPITSRLTNAIVVLAAKALSSFAGTINFTIEY